jgi:integrase/recombinase XerD
MGTLFRKKVVELVEWCCASRNFSFDWLIKDKNMGVRLIRSGRGKGRYVIDWRDEYGVRHSYTHGYSKRAADNFWHKQITLRAEHRTLDRKPISGITFYQLCQEYLDKFAKVRKWSWKTDLTKIKRFKAFFHDIAIEGITRPRINEYVIKRKNDGVQGSTINRETAILKRIFGFAVENGWRTDSPLWGWINFAENPWDDTFIEWPQYRALLNAVERLHSIPTSGRGWRGQRHLQHFRYMIPLAYEAGARHGEIAEMTKDDLDLVHRRVRFTSKKGKNRGMRVRWVPMTEYLYQILSGLPLNSRTTYLFPDENGHRWGSEKSFYQQWRHIAKEAGIPGVTFYRLRHSFCSILANKGVEASTRMRLMGHSSAITQARYTHISMARKRQVLKIFDELHFGENGGNLEKTAEKPPIQYNAPSENGLETQVDSAKGPEGRPQV